eukprot:6468577-Amphidinium_carterae.2
MSCAPSVVRPPRSENRGCEHDGNATRPHSVQPCRIAARSATDRGGSEGKKPTLNNRFGTLRVCVTSRCEAH